MPGEAWTEQLKTTYTPFSGSMREGESVVLYRDHMGIAPMYYYLKGHDFAYAKDMRELCARPGADLAVNEKWLYLEWRGANTLTLTETEFRYIHAVRPGSWREFTPGASGWETREHVYWEPGKKKIRFARDEDYAKELRRLVELVTREQLAAIEGPVGAEASGGLDSGVIDILLSRMGREAHYVSWSAPYDRIPMQPVDERRVLEDVLGQEGKTFRFLPEPDADIWDARKRMLPPFINTMQISQTAKLVRELGATTVFTGHGGDEGISHRCNLVELWHHGEYGAYLREAWLGTRGKKLRVLRAGKRALKGIFGDLPRLKRGWQNKDEDLGAYLDAGFAKRMEATTPFPPLYFAFDPVKYILQGGSRSRIDNCNVQAGEYGVRYIFPFLDPRVIDFAVSIPRRLYYHNGHSRWIYREAFRDLMPESLYEVDYKDFPSLRDRKPEKKEDDRTPEEKLADRRKRTERILGLLDWNRWSAYFDREACERLLTRDPDEMSEEDKRKCFNLVNRLNICSLVQNLQDHAGKWVEEHGKAEKVTE